MHPAKHVGKYLQKCLQPRSLLRRHLRLSLHFDLNLDLNLDLNPSLHRALLAKFYPQLLKSFLATIFGSMFAAKHLWLQVQVRLAWYRQVRPPRQPVGRPLHGRIVVRPRPTTTHRCTSGPLFLPLLIEEIIPLTSPRREFFPSPSPL